ncbi:MAG: c-type cytochrome [Deltaproteobacteria bacterium]|nr:c-type cytochrome [Deltaproteobacteria bacterium]
MRLRYKSQVCLALMLLPAVAACSGHGSYEVRDDSNGSRDDEPFTPGPDDPPSDDVTPNAPAPTPAPPVKTNAATPISGGTLTVLADGRTAVASDPDRDKVYVVDLTQKKVMNTISLSVGDEPGRVVEDAAGRVHVVLRGAGAIATLSSSSHTLSQRRTVCGAPRGIAYDKARDQLVVACLGGELAQMAPSGGTSSHVMLDKDLRDVVVMGDRYLISRFKTASLLTFDPISKSVKSRVDAPLSPMAKTKQSFKTFEGLYEANTGAAGVAYRMVPVRGGGAVMLHQEASNSPLSTREGGYTSNLCKGSTVGAAVTTIDSQVTLRSSGHFQNLPLPVDVAVSASGKTIAIASAASDVDPNAKQSPFRTRRVTVIARSAVDTTGDCMFPPASDGTMDPVIGADSQGGGGSGGSTPPDDVPPDIISYRQPSGQTTALAFDGNGRLIAQTREPAALEILSGTEPVKIALDTTSVADTGHSFFHMPVGVSALACASCHPEGGEDGRAWIFDTLGARRTQSLRGGWGDTGPFHWDGDMKDISQIMTDVFSSRMGGPALSSDQKLSVVNFVNSIANLKPSPSSDLAAVARGKALFNDDEVACATCHSGPQLTNNKSMNVGTKKAFQVPSLRGVAFRAPFMHDGCASTLSARFDKTCGGTSHGKVDQLSPAQLADLVTYLETL